MKSPKFVARSLLMFGVGIILSGTLALLPSMMQVPMNFPVLDSGWMMPPRGFVTMLTMFLVARVINPSFHPGQGSVDRGLVLAD